LAKVSLPTLRRNPERAGFESEEEGGGLPPSRTGFALEKLDREAVDLVEILADK